MVNVAHYKTISIEILRETVKDSYSFSEVLKKLGYISFTGSTFKYLKKYLQDMSIPTNHFLINGRRNLNKQFRQPLKEKEIFTRESKVSRNSLKEYIFKHNLIENKCSICKAIPMWNNKKLVLILDHINGIPNDNRLKNLRLLCPNCNSQTETFGSKNIRHLNNPDKKNKFKQMVEDLNISKEAVVDELKSQKGPEQIAKRLNVTVYQFNQICEIYNLDAKTYYICQQCGKTKKTGKKDRVCSNCSQINQSKFIIDKIDLENMLVNTL